jgi:DNA-binding CsgD family transcriptional regulator
MGNLGTARNDPRQWRIDLLASLIDLLHASAGAAFILRLGEGPARGPAAPPALISLFEMGFKSEEQRQAFLHEFNTAPFLDPFFRAALEKFTADRLSTLTLRRPDLIEDRLWRMHPHVQTHRRAMGMGDCLLSLHRASERHRIHAILMFKPCPSLAPGAGPLAGAALQAGLCFTNHDRQLLDILQHGLDWLYRAEESAHAKLNRASALSPRLRQTLELLLAGRTERQVAQKMNLSIHTVHDYVKALYAHFGVSSRNELLTRWMQTGGQLPPRKKGAADEWTTGK